MRIMVSFTSIRITKQLSDRYSGNLIFVFLTRDATHERLYNRQFDSFIIFPEICGLQIHDRGRLPVQSNSGYCDIEA